jgi:single-strand DNA-binding protein
MATFNKVILVGNLTRDPELSYTPGGSAVCKFSLALNEKYKNKQTGQDVEKVHFIDVTAWMKTGEMVAQYFHKGDPILIEGKLQQDRWEDQATQQKRSKVYVTAERFSFIGSKKQDGNAGVPAGQEAPAGIPEEDIPF